MLSQELEQILMDARPADWADLEAQAHALRIKKFGLKTSFVETHNINPTNICTLGCSFCAFATGPASPDAYDLSWDQIIAKLRTVPDLTEVCLQAGINPFWKYRDYLELLKEIRKNFPQIHIHAFSPQEVHHLTNLSDLSLERVLDDLQEAGINSMPGTAAEILVDEVRQKVCPQKINSQRWLEVVAAAHRQGIPTSATILFGHIEGAHHIAAHFQKIRELQQETGGFTEFILLPFIPHNTRLGKGKKMVSLEKIKQMVILSRLFFNDCIPHIQMSWPKVGLDFALAMQSCGSNDMGGTLHEENISRLAGADAGGFCSKQDLARGILQSGFVPWERDTVYNEVKTHALA